jgi:hypothetical protein
MIEVARSGLLSFNMLLINSLFKRYLKIRFDHFRSNLQEKSMRFIQNIRLDWRLEYKIDWMNLMI